MKRFNKISDEELAAYLDGMLSNDGVSRIDAVMDIDTFEVLNASRRAVNEFSSENAVSLPSWDNVAATPIRPMYYEPLAMAGFLGDSNADETADETADEETDESGKE